MTSVSGPVREAIRRGDLDWLTHRLGVADYSPAVLELLLNHVDPRLRHWGLDRLAASSVRVPLPGRARPDKRPLYQEILDRIA